MTSLTESLREVQNDIREYFEVGDTTLYAAVTALMNIKLELDTIITTLEQATNDVERVREEFERWADNERLELTRWQHTPERYNTLQTQIAWEAWQAALTQKQGDL